MTGVDDAWRHDELGWFEHAAGVDDEQLTELDITPYVPVSPMASANAIGIDCASYQGSPNFAQVAASGRSFCYLKSSEGASTSYPTLDAQYQGATAAGLITGLYHFAQPSLTPEANADSFSAQVNRLGAVQGHLPPCLDLEVGTGDLSGWAQRFVARLRQNTGCVRVMVYSSTSFFRNQITENWMDSNIALWMAHPGQPPGQPGYLTPRVAMHQYSSTGLVSGIAGNVDLNYMIWPLSTLVPSEAPPVTNPPAASTPSGLTADQAAQLLAAYQQLSGSATMGAWSGWPTWPGGTNESLTLVDYARRANVVQQQLLTIVQGLAARTNAPTAASGALSDSDVQRIAVAVATQLGQKLGAA